uniref:Uncharacterized protein n=1 Tax=Leersia perrieri TaxID=77586 RepID=A0A0D9W4D1_9ORYZ
MTLFSNSPRRSLFTDLVDLRYGILLFDSMAFAGEEERPLSRMLPMATDGFQLRMEGLHVQEDDPFK